MIIGLFYYCLTNINPSLRSKLQSIMLFAVVKTSYIVEHGVGVILEPLIEDLKRLESVSNRSIMHIRRAKISVYELI